MSHYQYRALATDGSLSEGDLEAANRQEAFRLLEGSGLRPVGLTESAVVVGPGQRTWRLEWRRKKISFSALENFTRQLSSLLAAGVSLSRALRILGRESTSAAASEKWKDLHDLVVDGSSLANAMAQSPEIFPRVYVAMVQAGEAGGFLDVVLAQIAAFQRLEKELRSKVLSALIYPAVLAALCAVVLAFLMVYFIPRFSGIFADFGASLPALTRAIVSVSEWVRHYGAFVLLVIVAAGITAKKWLQTDTGRRSWERLVLRLPIFGNLSARFAMVRFCRMLGTLTRAGVPLIQALRVARESIGNQTLIDAVNSSIERVQRGERLADSLSGCPELFPGSVLEMISVSEETGRLDEELVRLAAVTEEDLDRQLRTAVSLAEPALLFLMAAVIGTIVVGMLLPIFSLQEYIR